MQHITTGVPQGSIFAPSRFLIHMNDLPNASPLFKYKLFADDTSSLSFIEYSIPINDTSMNDSMNIELCNICNWLAVNTLSVNLSRTKFMVFNPHRKYVKDQIPNLMVNGSRDWARGKLQFPWYTAWQKSQLENSRKFNRQKAILIFWNIKSIETLFVFRMLYFCLVNSQCSYGLLSWGFQCKRLEKLQKRIIRIITCSK